MTLSRGIAAGFRLNILATILGSWVSNPWTAPFFYATGYKLGDILVAKFPCLLIHLHFLHKGTKIYKLAMNGQKLILGSIIISMLIATVCYFIVLESVKIYRFEKEIRRQKRRNLK
jgi:uncharacterized protein (DUF2062 family)